MLPCHLFLLSHDALEDDIHGGHYDKYGQIAEGKYGVGRVAARLYPIFHREKIVNQVREKYGH